MLFLINLRQLKKKRKVFCREEISLCRKFHRPNWWSEFIYKKSLFIDNKNLFVDMKNL